MNMARKIFAKLAGYDSARITSDRQVVTRESKNEDGILSIRKRAVLVANQRDAIRNTTFSPATALQLQINVVGNEGGKLTFTTQDEEFNREAGSAFRRWAKHCGFTEGMSLNESLQLLLLQLTHDGGDFIAVFDDGCLTGGNGSGRIRVFESDEIKNVEPGEFAKLYGTADGFTQSNGIVYDRYHRVVGAFVSTHGRERDDFRAGEYIHLKLAIPADFTGANWIHVANRWRQNQGRGVSTATHVTNLLKDLAETQGAEVQAAKLNAGFGIVITDEDAANESSAMNGWTDGSSAGIDLDEEQQRELDEAEAAENSALKQASTQLSAGKSAIIKLSGKRTLDSFKTERPNLNTVDFIRQQRNEAGTVYGLPSCYTTLEPAGSYTAFRGAMVMAERAFARLRKKLERDYLDWVAVRFIAWSGMAAPDGYEDCLLWRWPRMAEVDEGAAQTAIERAVMNGTDSLTGIFGPEHVENVVAQQAREKAAFEAAGLVYVGSKTVAGAVVSPEDVNGGADKSAEGEETTSTEGETNEP